MKLRSFILSAMIGLLSTVSFGSSISEIKDATHELWANGNRICSGQFVSPTLFVTAGHCIYSDVEYSIHIDHGSTVEVVKLEVNRVNYGFDVATLSAPDNYNFSYVDVNGGNIKPQWGDQVLHAGFPKAEGYEWVQYGTYQDIVLMPQPLWWLHNSKSQYGQMVAIEIMPGASGGGLYIQDEGEWYLTGTLTGGLDWRAWFTTNLGLNYVIKISE